MDDPMIQFIANVVGHYAHPGLQTDGHGRCVNAVLDCGSSGEDRRNDPRWIISNRVNLLTLAATSSLLSQDTIDRECYGTDLNAHGFMLAMECSGVTARERRIPRSSPEEPCRTGRHAALPRPNKSGPDAVFRRHFANKRLLNDGRFA